MEQKANKSYRQLTLPAVTITDLQRREAPLRRKNGIFHIYGTYEIIMFVKQESIRTTVDIPAPLYRKLKEQAAGTGSSIRELVLLGVRRVVLQAQRPRPKRVEFPLIVSKGPQVDLTNEQIYEHVEFP